MNLLKGWSKDQREGTWTLNIKVIIKIAIFLYINMEMYRGLGFIFIVKKISVSSNRKQGPKEIRLWTVD